MHAATKSSETTSIQPCGSPSRNILAKQRLTSAHLGREWEQERSKESPLMLKARYGTWRGGKDAMCIAPVKQLRKHIYLLLASTSLLDGNCHESNVLALSLTYCHSAFALVCKPLTAAGVLPLGPSYTMPPTAAESSTLVRWGAWSCTYQTRSRTTALHSGLSLCICQAVTYCTPIWNLL